LASAARSAAATERRTRGRRRFREANWVIEEREDRPRGWRMWGRELEEVEAWRRRRTMGWERTVGMLGVGIGLG